MKNMITYQGVNYEEGTLPYYIYGDNKHIKKIIRSIDAQARQPLEMLDDNFIGWLRLREYVMFKERGIRKPEYGWYLGQVLIWQYKRKHHTQDELLDEAIKLYKEAQERDIKKK